MKVTSTDNNCTGYMTVHLFVMSVKSWKGHICSQQVYRSQDRTLLMSVRSHEGHICWQQLYRPHDRASIHDVCKVTWRSYLVTTALHVIWQNFVSDVWKVAWRSDPTSLHIKWQHNFSTVCKVTWKLYSIFSICKVYLAIICLSIAMPCLHCNKTMTGDTLKWQQNMCASSQL